MTPRNCFTTKLLLLFGVLLHTSAFVVPSANSYAQHSFQRTRKARIPHTPQKTPTQLDDAALSAVETFFITKPYVSAFLTCSVKASAADWIAQTQQLVQQQTPTSAEAAPQEFSLPPTTPSAASVVTTATTTTTPQDGSSGVDVSRNLAFLLYGGLYQGMAQQFMYSNVFPDMFGHELDLTGLACQVAFDMTVVGPFLCLPIAYIVKGLFSSSSSDSDNPWDSLWHEGLEKYGHDVMTQGLLLKYWALWTPVNFLTFGVVPAHFRVAFVAAVSFFWVFILSSTAAATSSSSETTTDASASSSQRWQPVHSAD